MRSRLFGVFFFLGTLAGCASTGTTAKSDTGQAVQPPASTIAADIDAQLGAVHAPADKALIYLYRPRRLGGSANTYQIALNGTPVANMKVGTRMPYTVSPGSTRIQGKSLANVLNIGLSLGMMEKADVTFDAEVGRVYFIDVQTGFAGGPKFVFVEPATGLKAIKDLKVAEPLQEGEKAR